MKYLLLLFSMFTIGCESYIYSDYKIIKHNKNSLENRNLNSYEKNYLVKKGDNLYSISRKFKIPINEIIKVNKIKEPYKIFPSQKITIPILITHKIRKGETLYSISRYYGTNVYTLSKMNSIININSISVGQDLVIPKKILLKSSHKSEKKWDHKFVKKEKLSYKTKSDTKTLVKFIWPVKGKLISRYGKSKEGFYNDGINIDSQKGTAVISSQDGKVIYSGNEIPGYGNLILIKHSKNWITAYAHLNEVFIKKGNFVKKGQKIGSVGSTGNVRSPQLHFEIRKGKESVDPLEFL